MPLPSHIKNQLLFDAISVNVANQYLHSRFHASPTPILQFYNDGRDLIRLGHVPAKGTYPKSGSGNVNLV